MDNREHYRITSSCAIPVAELFFSYSRSSGKGGAACQQGQHQGLALF